MNDRVLGHQEHDLWRTALTSGWPHGKWAHGARGHLAGETEAHRAGDAAGRRTHTGEGVRNPMQEGVWAPHLAGGEMGCRLKRRRHGPWAAHSGPGVLPAEAECPLRSL